MHFYDIAEATSNYKQHWEINLSFSNFCLLAAMVCFFMMLLVCYHLFWVQFVLVAPQMFFWRCKKTSLKSIRIVHMEFISNKTIYRQTISKWFSSNSLFSLYLWRLKLWPNRPYFEVKKVFFDHFTSLGQAISQLNICKSNVIFRNSGKPFKWNESQFYCAFIAVDRKCSKQISQFGWTYICQKRYFYFQKKTKK